jgi:hypothetical protein
MNRAFRRYAQGIWFSMPVQLLLLHLKHYQLLLGFWGLLFALVGSRLLRPFGAHILFLFPEYLDRVNALSTAMVGVGIAIFMLTWNISTFILFARHIGFLATTKQPFLKYSLNNAILPTVFLGFYFWCGLRYTTLQELLPASQIAWLAFGFAGGFGLTMVLAFGYFFGADATIYRLMPSPLRDELARQWHADQGAAAPPLHEARVDWYLNNRLQPRRPRNVSHYKPEVIALVLKQHHLAAVFSLLLAFAGLIIIGYFIDNRYFQVPAAASIAVFFSLLIAVAAAFSYFLRGWTVVLLLLLFLVVNHFYRKNVFDPRNKAYGLSYSKPTSHPSYDSATLSLLAQPANIAADSLAYIARLQQWKRKQPEVRPPLVVVCVSGGGIRSATFATNLLHQLDSATRQRLMPATFLIAGASGGMLGAAWYRQLYYRRAQGLLSAAEIARHLPGISGDLLNPLFSTFVARDLATPPQYFWYKGKRYKKDRGYAFEQKLNQNTNGWLNLSLAQLGLLEDSAQMPSMMMGPVITRDGRKLLIASRPARFMMVPAAPWLARGAGSADALDFMSFFAAQDAANLGLLSALRMNATFPYVLPNVWLPANPVIDVMDAGFRDNTGLETGMRFLYFFKNWIEANCSRVVLLQVRDKPYGGWYLPDESTTVLDLVTKPALLTQANLFRFQEYAQAEHLQWLQNQYRIGLTPILFQYEPGNKSAAASLSFHLTGREKVDLKRSLSNPTNTRAMAAVAGLLAAR